MKLYRIQIDLPEGNDEFWEEIALMKPAAAKTRIAEDLNKWMEDGGWLDAKVKVTDIFATEPLPR